MNKVAGGKNFNQEGADKGPPNKVNIGAFGYLLQLMINKPCGPNSCSQLYTGWTLSFINLIQVIHHLLKVNIQLNTIILVVVTSLLPSNTSFN